MWDTVSALVSDGMASNWGLYASIGFMTIGCGGLVAGWRARRGADKNEPTDAEIVGGH